MSAVVDAPSGVRREQLREQFRAVRATTEDLCRPLQVEDYVVQSMPDASPAKWHLAHTTWFFETFVLPAADPSYRPDAQYGFLFNSYYNAIGARQPRAARGLLSRPTVEETYAYRARIDERLADLLAHLGEERWRPIEPVFVLGLNHEQQHQELILTDIKHLFAMSPLRPAYQAPAGAAPGEASPPPPRFLEHPGGIFPIGHQGAGFAFDNEGPRHEVLLRPFALADRLATNAEYLEFMGDGGYLRPELWLSEGWDNVQAQGWTAPLYWERRGEEWWTITLRGMAGLRLAEPVCHLSFFEADAFARWSGARLPSEAEWEVAAAAAPIAGNLLESGDFHPRPVAAAAGPDPRQLFGDVWEWTVSSYSPYPGYRPAAGALGEYNGKFMCNQLVLRGGSCATPRSHIRATYRNFFPASARWQFSGVRLARDA